MPLIWVLFSLSKVSKKILTEGYRLLSHQFTKVMNDISIHKAKAYIKQKQTDKLIIYRLSRKKLPPLSIYHTMPV